MQEQWSWVNDNQLSTTIQTESWLAGEEIITRSLVSLPLPCHMYKHKASSHLQNQSNDY
jgi:hypothetical protein